MTARRESAADHVITYTPIQTHTQRQTYRTKQIKSLTDRHALVNAPTNTQEIQTVIHNNTQAKTEPYRHTHRHRDGPTHEITSRQTCCRISTYKHRQTVERTLNHERVKEIGRDRQMHLDIHWDKQRQTDRETEVHLRDRQR